VLKDGGSVITDPIAVATQLARDFSSRGAAGPPEFMALKLRSEQTPILFQHSSTPSFNKDFTLAELDHALSTVTSTSPGPDDIPYDFLTHLSSHRPDLVKYYNFLWNNGLPPQWKHSIVLPIPKPGKSSHIPSSYRPIALTNCLCKLMEKIVTTRLHSYLATNSLLDPHQSGFRMGHSTLDAVFV
jgi:hypothetical protein